MQDIFENLIKFIKSIFEWIAHKKKLNLKNKDTLYYVRKVCK